MKISDKTAFGQLGRRGCLGYEGRKTDLKDDERTTILSTPATGQKEPSSIPVITGSNSSSTKTKTPSRIPIGSSRKELDHFLSY